MKTSLVFQASVMSPTSRPVVKAVCDARVGEVCCWATWERRRGSTFIYAHMSRVISERDLDAIYVIGPGHGGPAAVANAWLEGTYSEVYPDAGPGKDGMKRLFRDFSFPGGIGNSDRAGASRKTSSSGYSRATAIALTSSRAAILKRCTS